MGNNDFEQTDNPYAAIEPRFGDRLSDFEQDMLERYDEELAKIVSGLRNMADTIERNGKIVGRDKTHHAAAARVIHELNWGVANLSVEHLIRIADDIVIARATNAAKAGPLPARNPRGLTPATRSKDHRGW